LLNVDFIRDVRFSSGGFNALYGDRLSSIMDLSFREGNREEFDGQLDFNFAGFGFVVENPLFKKKGSWLLSARRSYLDMLIRNIDMGTTLAPSYGDAQAKIVYDINPAISSLSSPYPVMTTTIRRKKMPSQTTWSVTAIKIFMKTQLESTGAFSDGGLFQYIPLFHLHPFPGRFL